MASLSHASRVCLRSATKANAAAAVRTAALSTTAIRPADGAAPWTSYNSPFKGETKGGQVPDFGKYISKNGEGSNKLVQYFMVGTMGALTAAGAKSTVQGGFFSIRQCDLDGWMAAPFSIHSQAVVLIDVWGWQLKCWRG